MAQLLALDPVSQLELHHVLQRNELSLTLRENVPLEVLQISIEMPTFLDFLSKMQR